MLASMDVRRIVRPSTNSYAAARKRLIYETVIDRSEPFRRDDEAKVDAAVTRSTNGQEHRQRICEL
jgi:hypothetical protein